MRLLAIFLSGIVAFAVARATEPQIENHTATELASLRNKIVSVEGIAWGKGWPGLGERVVLATGSRVFLEVRKDRQKFPNGRLVRVIGRLELRQNRAAQGDESGYSKNFEYWVILDPKIEVLEEIKSDSVDEFPPKEE